MHPHLGAYAPSSTVYCVFNTVSTAGAPITLASGTVRCYKNASTTEDDSGITLTTDFDSRTGLHHVAIDLSADTTFYAAGSEVFVVLTVGTVDSVSVVGKCVAQFSIVADGLTTQQKTDVATNALATTSAGFDGITMKQLIEAIAALTGGITTGGGTTTEVFKNQSSTTLVTITNDGTNRTGTDFTP